MYNRNFRSNSNFRGQRGFGRPRRGGGRRQRSFDPTVLIQRSAHEEKPVADQEYVAKNTFAGFAISDKLKANIVSCGYVTPTPIQDQAIPELLNGRDLVGIAKTGTGKTAAFLIPLINKLIKNPQERVLILAPTRELAVQIRDEFEKFSRGLNMYSVLCIGGVSMYGQIKILSRRPQFVIGTPGRLKDLERQRKLNFSEFKNIVLDEVDHMLDMGFIDDVNDIVGKLSSSRQSLFFSATLNPKIQSVMARLLRNPVIIQIASNAPTANVDQDIIRLNGKPKVEVLHEMLIKDEFKKVLIFGRTKYGVENLSRELSYRGFRAASIHGNKTQGQRQRAITDFKNDYIQILLATDIASRGLDINNVTHVINYDLPESYEDYVHRIGRTGRAGKKGKAYTFID
ncbi:MAG TPA: DEAD/DEAH box helicase [Patescibacteria group bacterium]